MLELFRRWDVVSGYDVPEAWLRRIAVRAAIRRRTREVTRRRLESAAMQRPDYATEPDTDMPFLASILGSLPRPDAEALALHHLADRPVGEVAEILGVSEQAARVRLSRARRRATEHLSGMRGTWVQEMSWDRTNLAKALRDHGYAAALETVMDDLQGCGRIQTHLRLEGQGRFLMTNREDTHLDHGRFSFEANRLTLHSEGFPGGVVHAATIDGDVLFLRQIENRNPLVKGAPDAAFQFALLGSAPLRWNPSEGKTA